MQLSSLYPPTLLLFLFTCVNRITFAQVSCDPVFPSIDEQVTIFYDASQGNGALKNQTPVYAHMGVITDKSQSPSDWKYVATIWATANAASAMENAGTNLWKKTITPRTFFGIPAGEKVLRLAFVFRNGSGNVVGRAADGGDIFYDVVQAGAPLDTRFLTPQATSLLLNTGTPIAVKAAASKTGALTLFDNGQQRAAANGKQLETTFNAGATGLHKVEFVATAGAEKDTASFVYIVPEVIPAQNPPAGTEPGINYISNTAVRLSLYAPNKQIVYAIGDFSDWKPNTQYQMRKSVDGTTWWIDVTGLQPGQDVRYQYLVDGVLRIADPLSTLVLDPGNDPFIMAETFPNMPAYPSGKTNGMVSVLQTARPPFNWTAGSYQRPKKTDLVIYEVLMRDFVDRHDYQTLVDSLDYLERLGITAIELMPINEFDGNKSWGYNPSFHKALDKYYGSPEALKTLVDECHKRNIAVILDVVFNQASGSSPLAQLYWDGVNNRPAADNPWLNPVAKHEYNVFNDVNHESAATKSWVKNCLKYWLSEFKIDGFRFDLSKGFTQKNTLGNEAAWSQYDASRIAIWKDYSGFIWSLDPAAYVILEHFADNTEEKELAEAGMMLWGNMYLNYKDVALGYSNGISADLRWVSYKRRGWNVPHLVGYMESHDEDRIGFEVKTYGNSAGGYNIKSLPVGLRRIEMLNNLLYTIPGPKMLWQFGELGYDFHINRCENGSFNPDCRTDSKPIRWDYYADPARRRLYNTTAALLHLRKNLALFETGNFTDSDLGGGNIRRITLSDNASGQAALVVANVSMSVQTTTQPFPSTGKWYEYYSGDSLTVTVTEPGNSLTLQAGEYRLYLNRKVALPPGVQLTATRDVAGPIRGLEVFPNPVSDLLTARFELLQAAEIQIEVFDLTGRLVQRYSPGNLPAGEQILEVQAETWTPGYYLLRVRDQSGAHLARPLVKK